MHRLTALFNTQSFFNSRYQVQKRVRDLIRTQQCPCLAWVIQQRFYPALDGDANQSLSLQL